MHWLFTLPNLLLLLLLLAGPPLGHRDWVNDPRGASARGRHPGHAGGDTFSSSLLCFKSL
jgi:hypothetical protein